MTAQHDLVQLQCINNGAHIVGHLVVIVTAPGLGGLAKTAQVYADAAVALLGQQGILVLKKIVVARPSVKEKNGFTAGWVDVLDIDIYISFCLYVIAHDQTPFASFYIDMHTFKIRIKYQLERKENISASK
ncbi:hypothetical protein SDC9_159554 [bioreactor metagenome]|uniref:Uncharacterized protein n=1 Tax=bioreactor metagenome TaxID=1076179 RepID=A0A645FFH9_9ZZZZ